MNLRTVFKYLRSELRSLRNALFRRINSHFPLDVINEFHKIYAACNSKVTWLGITTVKCPLDLWIYQEIIVELRPDLIIECGTASGGSALFLATICDLVDKGRIITIDIKESLDRPTHSRIIYLKGSSVSQEIKNKVLELIKNNDKVIMVILDSDHHKEHVLEELKFYSKLVTKGSYLIVEDTCINGHPIYPGFGPGPMEAVKEFLKGNSDFTIDKTREKLLLTFNPNGFLKKIN